MSEKVILREPTQLELNKFRDMDKMKEGAKNIKILAAVEEVASMWMKQITMVSFLFLAWPNKL